MTLYVKVVSNQLNNEQDLVLIHGWGFNGEVWHELLEKLLDWGYRIYVVDLPGHGQSSNVSANNLECWAEAVWEVVPHNAIWIGWSLGGMVALAAAFSKPKSIRALIIVGTSPRFIKGNDWLNALDPELLLEFGRLLQNDWRATLSRFLALQIAPHQNQSLRRLRSLLFVHPPDINALNAGLNILQHADLRSQLSNITCPTLVLLGERDTLVPATLKNSLTKLVPQWKIYTFKGAGHLPFITHQEEFLNVIKNWLLDIF